MSKITILDGATGTELQKRGYETKLPLWSASANLDAPDLVRDVHIDYLKSGADVITTNTFRTNIRQWRQIGKPEQAKLATEKAVELAVEARRNFPDAKIAGCITTVEDCYEPDLVPPNEELEIEHGQQVKILASTEIDFFLIETLNTIRESEVILKHASKTGLPLWISFVTNPEGDLLSGEKLGDAVEVAKKYNVEAILLNCRIPKVIIKAAEKLIEAFDGKKGIYANGDGQPSDGLGWEFFESCNPEDYVEHAKEWAKMGFEIIGGCCGTSPEHIKALTNALKSY